MAYLKDPRENRIGPNGELWESDNRTEKRYLWNGAYVDLCDLPPEEYMKTIFVTQGSGGGGEAGKEINNMIIVEEDGSGNVSFYVKSDKPAASKVTITLDVNTSNGIVKIPLEIQPGQTISNKGTVNYAQSELKPRVEKAETKPSFDNNFKYETKAPEILPSLYSLNLTIGNVDGMNDMDLLHSARKIVVDMKEPKESMKFTSNIKPKKIPNFDKMTPAEKDEAIAQNSDDIIFLTDKVVSDIFATDKSLGSDMASWTEKKTIKEEGSGIIYHVWVRSDNTGAQMMIPGGEDKNWDIIVTYK